MVIISPDGTGDFASIQAAVDAQKGGGRAPCILLVRKGVYHERVVVSRDNLRIVGEDRDETVLTCSACAKDRFPDGAEKGTFLSFTLLVTGCNVTVENLTVRNDAGDGREVGQAVAVYAAGDRGVFRNCRLIAHQDTLFCGPVMPKVCREIAPRSAGAAECVDSVGDCPTTHSRQYFEKCFIQGDVDFIFGPYRCWFERCELFMNERGGWYTAANTPEEQPWGFVFHACRLTGACGEGEAYLGRPWRKYARTLFLSCEMDACVSPAGFRDWDAERVVTGRLGEWDSRGVHGGQQARHPSQRRLTAEEACCVTLAEVLGGWDGWEPDQSGKTWFLCGDSTMADYIPSRRPMTGWGQVFPALLPAGETVENCAVNGRSSRSFIEEKRLHFIDCCLRPGDKLVVSFGHNDNKDDPKRHTDARTTFLDCLRQYAQIARAHGARMILATPIPRRRFDENGRLQPTHGDFPQAMRDFAREEDLPLVDLEKRMTAVFEAAGQEGTKEMFCHLPQGTPNYPDGAADDTHLQLRGAVRVAEAFLEGLRELDAKG